jgi:predicted RND superfamily exporter protein
MEKYVNFIFSKKKVLFVLFIVLNLVSLYGVLQIKLNTDFALFSTVDSVYETRLEEMETTFGSSEQIIVLVESDGFDTSDLSHMRALQGYLEEMDAIRYVEGIAPESVTINGTDIPIGMVDATMLENYYIQLGDFSPLKIVDDTYYFSFTLFLQDDFSRSDIQDIETYLEGISYDSYIAGDMYNQFKVVDYILSILLILPPVTILVILSVFRWQIGAFKPTILSVLPAAIGSLWTFGFIGYLGNEISILSAVVPIFIIVIGSADGLHFMSHYQEAILEGMPRDKAMTKTLKVVGIPMIITTLTSMAGFLSLLSMNTDSIVDLALFASLGIFLAGVATWYVLPLILSNNINVLPKHMTIKKQKLSHSLQKLWGLPSVLVVIIILIVSGIFYGQINNEFDMLSLYKEYTVVSQNATKLQEVNGGSIPLYVEIETDNVLTVETLQEITAFGDELVANDQIEKVMNPYAIIALMYDIQVGGDIPNDVVLSQLYAMLSSSDDAIINNMMNVTENKVRLLIFPSNMENDTLDAIENVVNNSDLNASITGVQYLLKDLNVNIQSMQINSIILAVSIVFVMLLVSLRDLKVAFLSTLPIVVTVAAIFAILGITGIPLNITTVIIFSISIGVGIDYAVHYSSVYKMYLKEGFDKTVSVQKAYNNVSRPIIANALGISLGMSVLMLSPLTIHFNVSILMWVGMIFSVLVTLTFLPTVLKLKFIKKEQ